MEVEIDADVGRWVLEFLLRQPLSDHLINTLITILPLANSNSSFKKHMLLRKLESEISNQSISETLLDLLQQIEEIDFRAGITEHSGSIKAAYVAVAVSCTIKALSNSGGSSSFAYFDAVKTIWRGRVCKLQKAETVGLISEELLSWKDDIEAAVWEDSACDILLKKSEGIDAIKAIRVYLKEEIGKMGPSFLESVADVFRVDEKLRGLLQVRDEGMDLQCDNQNAGPSHENREVHKGNVLSRRKQIANKRTKCALAGMNRGAKIADVTTSDADESGKRHALPPTPEVNRVLGALESSSLELHVAVKDPLSASLRIADNAASDMTRKDTSNVSLEESHARAKDRASADPSVTQANEKNLTNHSHRPPNNGSKPSLMAKNSTSCTLEWDDSIDEGGNRVQLPSPKSRVVSPPKKYENHDIKRRRKPKRWSATEEDTLRAGVDKFGQGNWKLILKAYRTIFEERTEVDLKDKWRNMTK